MQSAQLRCAGEASCSARCSTSSPAVPIRPVSRRRWAIRSSATASPPAPVMDDADTERVSQYVRPDKPTYAPPSIVDTGTLRPAAEWFPAWMKYRSREDNYVFWQDKFSRNSLDITWYEKRWTLFSTFWFMVTASRFYVIPPAIRFLFYLGWRTVMTKAYEAHKLVVLWQCKVDAAVSARGHSVRAAAAAGSSSSSSGDGESSGTGSAPAADATTAAGTHTFSRTMALRRLHWKNSLLAELLYLVNVYKTGRIHLLPPKKKPLQRPTFFWLF